MTDTPDPRGFVHAVCTIEGRKGAYGSFGQGVFIRPNLVLTCWHVLKGGEDLVFANDRGEKAEKVSGSRFNKRMSDSDLAVVHISKPLGYAPIKLAHTLDYMEDKKGTLVTRYDGRLGIYSAGLQEDDVSRFLKNHTRDLFKGTGFEDTFNVKSFGSSYAENFSGLAGKGYATYEVDKEMRPGYSGSPVFDSRGRLVTVVSSIPQEKVHTGSRTFFAPTPEKVSKFVKEVLDPAPVLSPEERQRLDSVCTIEVWSGENGHQGNGVFILPDVVATAWHVLKGAKDPVFINNDGEEARLLSGGIRKFNSELDLAVVELDRSLCRTPVNYGDTDDHLKDMKGTLVTRFTGKATAHKIGMDLSRSTMDSLANRNGAVRNFVSDQLCGPGYSGSPIFDSRGRVCSIITQGQWERQQDFDESNSFSYESAGPAPYRFAGFIKQALDI